MNSATQSLLFGDKNLFAFEIEPGITRIKGYMRLWIKGTLIGNNKRQSEFVHAISDFRKFYKTYETLYENPFDSMTPQQIYAYTIPEDLIWSEDPKDLEEATRRQIYTRFYGDQFDSICSFLSLYKNGVITFIIWFYKKKNNEYLAFDVLFKDYNSAIKEFIAWFKQNLAQNYPSLSFDF